MARKNVKPWIIAHRGGALEVFENSFEAFHHALRIGCDSIEVDLRATKDEEIVVMHDDTLERTTIGQGNVRDFTLEELRNVTLKNGSLIPTLEQLLSLANKKIFLHLEVKEAGFESKLIGYLEKFKMIQEVYVIGFLADVLEKIKTLQPAIKIGYTLETEKDLARAPKNCEILLPEANLLKNQSFVAELQGKSVKIHPWTVNDVEQASKLVSLGGIDGLITDCPSVFVALQLM